MQLCTVAIIVAVASAVNAVYPDNSGNNENDIGQDHSAGNAYGYSGSFSGSAPPNFMFPVFPNFDFSGFLNQYMESLNKYHQQLAQTRMKREENMPHNFNSFSSSFGAGGGGGAYSFAYADGFSKVHAQSSITFSVPKKRLQQQAQAAQAAASNGQTGQSGVNIGTRGGFASSPDGFSYSFAGPIGTGTQDGDGAAFASGSIGPDGVQQTASVYPENPNSPNINTRFGGSDGGSTGPGFRSVFTSSQSSTTNINGKPQTFRQASTTVNDNGKVTTYTAKNP